jgi:hypothetical protein
MFLGVAMDDVRMPPILASHGVDVLGWKQSQAKDTERRQAGDRLPWNHHGSIIGVGTSPSQTGSESYTIAARREEALPRWSGDADKP